MPTRKPPKSRLPPEPPADIDRFDEAVDAWRKRVPVTDDEWDELLEVERDHAFRVAEVTKVSVVSEVWHALDRAIANGTTFEQFKEDVGGKLAAEWGSEDSFRLETIFRTNVLSAYSEGRHEVMSAPTVRAARPFTRFDSVDDSRVSDICEALEGTILPADDPFWRTHTPPLHHNCRSRLVPLAPDEAAEEGIDDKAPNVDAAEGFGAAPARNGKNWEPEPEVYPEPLAAVLRGRLG